MFSFSCLYCSCLYNNTIILYSINSLNYYMHYIPYHTSTEVIIAHAIQFRSIILIIIIIICFYKKLDLMEKLFSSALIVELLVQFFSKYIYGWREINNKLLILELWYLCILHSVKIMITLRFFFYKVFINCFGS